MGTQSMTTSRTLLTLAALTLGLSGLACLAVPANSAHAQEVQVTGPLAGQPAVRHERVLRQGRVELTPQVIFSFQDEFERNIGFGLSATYHITDWLGIGIWGFYAPIHIETSLTDQVVNHGATTSRNRTSLPSPSGFRNQVGLFNWAVALQGVFIPLRGKLSLFQKLFLDADLYIAGGVAIVGVDDRIDIDGGANPCEGIGSSGGMVSMANPAGSTQPCLDTQARASRVAVTGTFAVGLRIYANDWMALNLEYRAVPFSYNASGTDEGGTSANGHDGFPDHAVNSNDWAFHFNHMFTIGWTFYLPTSARISE
jgi:outer membrane beta-barrel protein